MLKKKTNTIKNPCIHVCTLDENKVCIGCYRTLDEIRGWFGMSDEQKLKVIENTEKRRRERDVLNYDHYV